MYCRVLTTFLGDIYLVGDNQNLTNIYLGNKNLNLANYQLNNNVFIQEYQQLSQYFLGHSKSFSVPIKLVGTSFQIKVWQAIAQIPYAKTATYQQLACQIGMPKSYRAVANACGANNLPIIIPCHRVIRSDQTLAGFASGIEHKKLLLKFEQSHQNQGI